MSKPKVAFYWCASCGGCEEAVVDLAEAVLDVVQAVDIVLWPVALDFKIEDVRACRPGEIAVAFINGSVRNSEHEMWVKMLREKSQLVVAFGACAHLGGIPGLANCTTRDEIFQNKYVRSLTAANPKGVLPQIETWIDGVTLELPETWNTVRSLNQVIDVDYYLPGCAPPPDSIARAVSAILSGNLPPKGSVLASEKSLCETCPRNETKPETFTIASFKRLATHTPDPEKCFLEQGIVCVGSATRSGCGYRCIGSNMPCRGCYGPPPHVVDQGAKILSAIASHIDSEDPAEVDKILDTIPDPAGYFYRFGLPLSLLQRRQRRSV